MMKKLLLWSLFALTLSAQPLFEEGFQAYKEHNYTKAFQIFNDLYLFSLDEDAAYYLGVMHELGQGTPKDSLKAEKWYKISAKRYHDIYAQQYNHTYNKLRRYFFQNLEAIENNETKKTVQDMIESRFEFKAHNHNYFLPFGYQKNSYDSYVSSDVYTNREAEFQFSIRFDLASNLLGLQELYSGAYTQRSFWQIYANSAPFRENNYTPELFITFPMLSSKKLPSLKGVVIGLAHQSNGQGTTSTISTETPLGNRSRSWNYFYTSLHFQHNMLLSELKFWKRYKEDIETDDNPDLLNYLGHGSLKMTLPYEDLVTTLTLRYAPSTNRGAAELSLSFPVNNRDNIFWYMKFFSGYGESLIDYQNYINKSAFGLSFSR